MDNGKLNQFPHAKYYSLAGSHRCRQLVFANDSQSLRCSTCLGGSTCSCNVFCPKCCTATGPDELWNLLMTVGWHLAPSAFSRLGYEDCAFEPNVVPPAPTGGAAGTPSATYACPTQPQGQFVVLQILRPGQPTYLATCEIAVFGKFQGGGFNNVQCTSHSSISSSAAR